LNNGTSAEEIVATGQQQAKEGYWTLFQLIPIYEMESVSEKQAASSEQAVHSAQQ
jgi:hypothetical protein